MSNHEVTQDIEAPTYAGGDPDDDLRKPLGKLETQPKFAEITVSVTWEQLRFLIACCDRAGLRKLSARLCDTMQGHNKETGRRVRTWNRLREGK